MVLGPHWSTSFDTRSYLSKHTSHVPIVSGKIMNLDSSSSLLSTLFIIMSTDTPPPHRILQSVSCWPWVTSVAPFPSQRMRGIGDSGREGALRATLKRTTLTTSYLQWKQQQWVDHSTLIELNIRKCSGASKCARNVLIIGGELSDCIFAKYLP